jgi:hypothetical protein
MLTAALTVFGKVLSVTVRKKDGHRASWALASFVEKSAADHAVEKGGVEVRDRGKKVWLEIKKAQFDSELKKRQTGALASTWAAQEQKIVAATRIQAVLRGSISRKRSQQKQTRRRSSSEKTNEAPARRRSSAEREDTDVKPKNSVRRGSVKSRSMRRRRDSVDEAVVEEDDEVAPGSATTVWVGGLPENCADDPAVVTDALKVFGQVLSVTVRAKPGHCKSWAFATFVDQASHAQAASAGSLTVADGAGKAVTLTLKAAKVDKELKKEETGALATMWAGQEQKLVAATPIPSTGMELRTPRGAGADNEEGETHGGVTRALKRTLTRTLSRNPSSPITLHHTGNKRVWPCINDFLPLNDSHELNFLVSTWAHPRLVIDTLRSRPKRGGAAFGPSGEETFLNGITTQPIEEIRDYFGEQIALYFAFLRVYTNSLVFPTVIGMLTMIGHLRNGVEGNPLSLAYSILVSFWSVAFIKKWRIRQAELCFLWGTSTFEANQKTRKNFRLKEGEIKFEMDEFTGKNEPVPKNPRMVYYRTAASVLVGTFFIFTVVVAALSAEYVRMLSKPNQLGKYSRVVGSSLNACAILILSQIYGRVANVLTEWENHRVQTAFEDAMIL